MSDSDGLSATLDQKVGAVIDMRAYAA